MNKQFLPELPIYKKAKDISLISRNISNYIIDDLNLLDYSSINDKHLYFTGDIIQQSTNLIPEIVSIEKEKNSQKKATHLERLEQLTYKLNKSCKKLESSKSNGKDFLKILRQEVKKFNHLKKSWILTL